MLFENTQITIHIDLLFTFSELCFAFEIRQNNTNNQIKGNKKVYGNSIVHLLILYFLFYFIFFIFFIFYLWNAMPMKRGNLNILGNEI